MALVASLQERLRAMEVKLAAVEAENVELRARLGQNSQNSSRPPSSDMPGTRPPPPRKKGKKRRRGGQPGHVGRFAAEPDHIDEVKQYRALTCMHCDADLGSGTPTGSFVSHPVYTLPEIRPIITDHQCIDVQCVRCGLVTPGRLPPAVPKGAYDPSVQAMTGLLRGEMRQSMRQTSAVMTDVLHVPMSPGAVAKTQEQVSAALAAPFGEAHAHAMRDDRAHADESGWREDKKKAWLWVAVTALVTVFLVRRRRNAESARDLLGRTFAGIVITDRWGSYNWIAPTRRQLCWSHLKRDFKSFLDYGPEAQRVGKQLLSARKGLLRRWQRVRDGTMTREAFQKEAKPIRARILRRLEEGGALPCKKVSGMCREMLKLKDALFTFIDVERVEPTNNTAERAIRFAVLLRKGCFGSDSERGSRFIERFLTARQTLRRQKRDLYGFLKQACAALLQGTAPPSLLPESARLGPQFAVA